METIKSKPTYNESDLETILISKQEIDQRIDSLAAEISNVYENSELTMVCVLSGALLFAADLLRKLSVPTRLDCIRADSYRNSTRSMQPPEITHSLKTDIAGKHVLIVDDILDTGKTLNTIINRLSDANPASIRSCVLLDKKARRQIPIDANFVGFPIQDSFVVGYGLDFAERYRDLTCIGSLKVEFQRPSSET